MSESKLKLNEEIRAKMREQFNARKTKLFERKMLKYRGNLIKKVTRKIKPNENEQ